MSKPARHLLSGALLAPLLLLAACGEHHAVADPPLSPASPSPSAQPPQHETPEAFIRRWAAAEKRMENTGYVDAYLALSSRCEPCTKLAHEVSQFYRANGYVRWDGWHIKSISRSLADGSLITYVVRIDSAPTTYRATAKGPIQHLAGGPSTELLTLARTQTGWSMNDTVEEAS